MIALKQSPRKSRFFRMLKAQWGLQVIILLGLTYLVIFNYIPMSGIMIAFRKFKLSSGVRGFFTGEWVGIKWFVEFITDYKFSVIVRNTLVLSLLKLIFSFPLPIVFAVMLNELRRPLFKRIVQTASYLPHFISWIIVSGLCTALFSSFNGMINQLLISIGVIDTGIPILTDSRYYWPLAILTEIWKEIGWSAIIFIAAIAGVDAALYEAAEIDGAGRLRRIWHVTLPGIKGTVIIMFVLALGGLTNGNFEQAYLLGNNLNRERSEIIQIYVLTVGLRDGRYDYAAAVGLMQSSISLLLVLGSNTLSRKYMGAGLY